VIIGVTDSGVFVDHPDLMGSFWVNPAEVPTDRLDNDNNSEARGSPAQAACAAS
jgi:hypothetical protein